MPFNPNTPRSRDEVLLQAIVSGDSTPIGDPRDREEEFVAAISDAQASKLSRNWFEATYKNSSAYTVSANSGVDFVCDICEEEDELRAFLGDRKCYGILVKYNFVTGDVVTRSVYIEPYDSETNSTGSVTIRIRNVTGSAKTLNAKSTGVHLIYYK